MPLYIQRTNEGLASARARRRKGGRPKTNPADLERALKLYHSNEYSLQEVQAMTGVSRATIYRSLKW